MPQSPTPSAEMFISHPCPVVCLAARVTPRKRLVYLPEFCQGLELLSAETSSRLGWSSKGRASDFVIFEVLGPIPNTPKRENKKETSLGPTGRIEAVRTVVLTGFLDLCPASRLSHKFPAFLGPFANYELGLRQEGCCEDSAS